MQICSVTSISHTYPHIVQLLLCSCLVQYNLQVVLHVYSSFPEPSSEQRMIHEGSKRTDFQAGRHAEPNVSLYLWSQATLDEAFLCLILLTLLVSKVMCCQLTVLTGMNGRWSTGERMRSSCTRTLGTWTRCGALPAFFTEVLVRRKIILADGLFDWGFPSGSEGSRQRASSSQNLASLQILQSRAWGFYPESPSEYR